ncbi:MAG: glycosyltransferase family 4 protein [bacterium]|nr:glycosyltransferase family 4 protein [bacterium]
MKTILFFSPTGHIGGAERNLINMCRYLPEDKYRCVVVLPEEGELPSVLSEAGAELIYLKAALLQSGQIFKVLAGCFSLRRKLSRSNIKVDIVHTNSIFSLYIPVYFGRIFKKPVFIHWADFDVRKGDRHLVNIFSDKITIFAVSKSIEKCLIDNGIKKHIIRQLYYGNEEPVLINDNKSINEFRAEYKIKDKDVIFAVTGRIDEWKGHKYALKALARLKKYDVKLFILGSYHLVKNPDLKNEMEEIIKENDLEKQVIFTGHINDPLKIMQYFDVILAPSYYEPFGLVATEAMSLGKPVIASNAGGFRESVDDGISGFLVPPEEVDGLADKMKFLLKNTDLRKSMGKSAYKRYKDKFSMSIFINKLGSFYEGC